MFEMEAQEVAKRFAGFYFGVLSSNPLDARRLYSPNSVRSELRGSTAGDGDGGVEGVQAEGADAIQDLITGATVGEGLRNCPNPRVAPHQKKSIDPLNKRPPGPWGLQKSR